MFNSSHKKSELKKLEEAHKDLELKVNEVSELCITLAKIRNQSSIKIISNIEKYLNNPTNFNRVLANTLDDFKKQFAAFTSELYETNVDKKSDNDAETLLRTPIDFIPSVKMAFDTTFNFSEEDLIGSIISSYQVAISDKDKSIIKKESFQVGSLGMLGAFVLGGPIGWSIGLGSIIGSGMIASSENKNNAEKASKLLPKYIEIDGLLQLAFIEINELIEHTQSEYQAYENTFNNLLSEQNEDDIHTDIVDNSSITALVKHITTLSILLSQKVDL